MYCNQWLNLVFLEILVYDHPDITIIYVLNTITVTSDKKISSILQMAKM